jgi:hypothetical protein
MAADETAKNIITGVIVGSSSGSRDVESDLHRRRRRQNRCKVIATVSRFSVIVGPNGTIIASPHRHVQLRGPFFGRPRVGQEPDVGQQLRQTLG